MNYLGRIFFFMHKIANYFCAFFFFENFSFLILAVHNGFSIIVSFNDEALEILNYNCFYNSYLFILILNLKKNKFFSLLSKKTKKNFQFLNVQIFDFKFVSLYKTF